jgi:hypothetical protein
MREIDFVGRMERDSRASPWMSLTFGGFAPTCGERSSSAVGKALPEKVAVEVSALFMIEVFSRDPPFDSQDFGGRAAGGLLGLFGSRSSLDGRAAHSFHPMVEQPLNPRKDWWT